MINLLLSGGKSDYFKGVLLVAVYLVRIRRSVVLMPDCGCFSMVRAIGLIGIFGLLQDCLKHCIAFRNLGAEMVVDIKSIKCWDVACFAIS
jgi:hypothetical protein